MSMIGKSLRRRPTSSRRRESCDAVVDRTPRRRRQRDKGAVAAICGHPGRVGVVMSMLALTVDVGNIMAERRQLQNGADAASLRSPTAAPSKSARSAAGTAAARLTLQNLAGANAKDGRARSPCFGDGTESRDRSSASDLARAPGLPLCTILSSPRAESAPLASALPAGGAYVEPYAVEDNTNPADDSTNPLTLLLRQGGPSRIQRQGVRGVRPRRLGARRPVSRTVLPWPCRECDWTTPDRLPGPSTTYPPLAVRGLARLRRHRRPARLADRLESAVYSKGNPTHMRHIKPGGTAPGGFAWLDGTTARARP